MRICFLKFSEILESLRVRAAEVFIRHYLGFWFTSVPQNTPSRAQPSILNSNQTAAIGFSCWIRSLQLLRLGFLFHGPWHPAGPWGHWPPFPPLPIKLRQTHAFCS